MYKKWISLICALTIAFTACPAFSAAEESAVTVILDGEEISFPVPPRIEKDCTMVPLRRLAEVLDAQVAWNAAAQSVSVTKDGNTLSAQVGNQFYRINGRSCLLPVQFPPVPLLDDGCLLVPLRALTAVFPVTASWVPERRTVLLSSGSGTDSAALSEPDLSLLSAENRAAIDSAFQNGELGDELYLLASGGGWGGKGTIAVYTEDAHISLLFFQENGRYQKRNLTEEEFGGLISFLAENTFDALPDWYTGSVDDGTEYEYLHYTKETKTAIYMNNPGISGGAVHDALVQLFFHLAESGQNEVHYLAEASTPGLRLAIRDEDNTVVSVWKNGEDYRVLTKEKIINAPWYANLTWHSFDGRTIGEKAAEPEDITLQDAWADIPTSTMVKRADNTYGYGGYSFQENRNNYPWQCTWNGWRVRVLKENSTKKAGLYLTKQGEEPVFIREGDYNKPVVLPETDWVVCTKTEHGEGNPHALVKINLKTFAETTFDLGSTDAHSLSHVTIADGKLYITSNRRWYTYDAATDTFQEAEGDFSKLYRVRERFFQRTGSGGAYYYAEPEGYGDPDASTTVGTLDAETFAFTPIAVYENLCFDSMEMWVDEPGQTLCVVTNGDLLELPFPAPAE